VRLSDKESDRKEESSRDNCGLLLLAAVAGASLDAVVVVGRGSSSSTCKAYFSTLVRLPLSWKINCNGNCNDDGNSRQDNDVLTYEPS